MSQKTETSQKWAVASVALQDAYTDFILSRQAMLCTPETISWYGKTAGKFMQWLEANGVNEPSEILSRHVRAYLSELAGRGLADTTIHGHARAIKTFCRFSLSEGYMNNEIAFQMPRIAQKRLSALSAGELKAVVAACQIPRDKALVCLLADTGIRRAELVSLNWGDLDVGSGLVRIARGKGGKARSVVVGIKTRRALLKYRRTVEHNEKEALIQTQAGRQFTFSGLRSALLRIGNRAGIHISPHILRRTFATLSLRAGMNVLHLQGLLGHSSLEMTRKYVQMLEGDLVEAHREYGPIDNL